MSERIKMISEYLDANYSVAELARRYEVSRRIFYKWLERYERGGWEALKDQTRAPRRQALAISEQVEAAILELKARWPDWGAPKLRHKLAQQLGRAKCPAESTVSAVLKRHGLIRTRRPKRRPVPGGLSPLEHCREANALWCADFKGWWLTGDRRRCEPLTVSDAWSRFLLRCAGMNHGTTGPEVRAHFELLFREYGLPLAIRTDNGPPFASVGLGGLTALSVWWLRLGLRLERITPGCPQENGRHERIHLSLEQSRARHPRATLGLQQKALEQFRHEYNHERPHEALGQRVPAELYRPSPRTYNGRLPAARSYPDGWMARRVTDAGQMKWEGKLVMVTRALAGEHIGLEPRGDGVWAVWFENLEMGSFEEPKGRIRPNKHLPATAQPEVES
jgi:transposase InsO family protein